MGLIILKRIYWKPHFVRPTGADGSKRRPYDDHKNASVEFALHRGVKMDIASEIPSVNFHLWKPCNMRCRFCFATFQDLGQDVLPKGHLSRGGCLAVVDALASAGFGKINFAGGEPTLCPWLPDLIGWARELGLTTSIVTNGSRITPEWLGLVGNSLDWAALSIDTVDPQKLEASGRTTREGPLSEDDYLGVVAMLKDRSIRVKINTVVTRSNCDEDLTGFIARARPERWKLLQVLPVGGQNDGLVDDQVVTVEQFDAYVVRNRRVEDTGVAVVPEDNELMTGSYVMVDPAGRFFDNTAGAHVYSQFINDVGVEAALRDVSVDPSRFRLRGGLYAW